MSKNSRFWRNVTLIALAHVVLIAGLIRWSLAARSAPDAESLIWLSAGDLERGRSDNSVASTSKISIPSVESEPLKPDEEEKEQPPLIQAKSEIELPKTMPMETPVPKATAKPKATPKSTSKPTPSRLLKNLCWRKRPNHRRTPSRVRQHPRKAKPTRVMRKRRARKLNRQPITARGRQVQRARAAIMQAVGRAHPNSAGMETCCMTGFTAHGSNQRLPSLPAQKFRRWRKFESKRTVTSPNSKSSNPPKTLS